MVLVCGQADQRSIEEQNMRKSKDPVRIFTSRFEDIFQHPSLRTTHLVSFRLSPTRKPSSMSAPLCFPSVRQGVDSLNTRKSHVAEQQSTRPQCTPPRQHSGSTPINRHRFGPEAELLEARLMGSEFPVPDVGQPNNDPMHPMHNGHDGLRHIIRRACHKMLIRGGRHIKVPSKPSWYSQIPSFSDCMPVFSKAPFENSIMIHII
ncbi:hypothetical protein FRC02_003027 [Tulasnella sp. 418]|nr:hypothetical protein FRC02_003027 [Tulasnella sp. 418]